MSARTLPDGTAAPSQRAYTRAWRELADRATPPPSEDGGWLGKLLAIGIQALLMSLAGGKRS